MALEPGSNLGGRFAIVGVLGSGGTATVYLAVDQLRGDKVALKVVHGHLAADARVRRRLQREVRAATLLHHEAALVPWDLHELDGSLALSMPYHPGRTLRERVASQGALSIPEVKALGGRVAGALAAAHRSGLLHLDVTPNNVLVDGGEAPVLTDFGLSRAQTDATRSTSVMGTAGFMAPERLGGQTRPQPSADLYGLGCVLYYAVTGQAPFATDNPMAALQAQLSERYTPVRELRPDCPEALAQTIQALLAKDPASRPASAAQVRDALAHGHSIQAPRASTPPRRTAHIEPGVWSVVVRERPEDSARRKQLRIDAKKVPNSLEAVVSKRARDMMQGVLTYVGLKTGGEDPPERLLVHAVANEAGVDPAKLSESLVLVQQELVLVDGVSRDAAKRIASDARSAGFQTEVLRHPVAAHWVAQVLQVGVTLGWIAFGLSWVTPYRVFSFYFLFVMIAFSIVAGRFRPDRSGEKLEKLPVAYTARLNRWLADAIPGRFPLDEPQVEAEPTPAPVVETRAQALLARVQGEIDGLLAAVASLQLNPVAASDLRDTARALQERAEELAAQLGRLDEELAREPEDTSWMEPRLDRLRTKQRAGERVDPDELAKLEASLRSAREAEALRERLESQHTASVAGLLEIGAAATTARRNLLADPAEHTTNAAVKDLALQAELADRARREMASIRS